MSESRSGAALLVYDFLLYLGAALLTPWILWRCLREPAFRRGLPGRLGWISAPAEAAQRPLLLHGVSVGEVKALRPLVRLLRARHPQVPLVISSSTPGGLATARQAYPDLPVVSYPVDLPGATRRFLERTRPRSVVLAELEIWPNFLTRCHARGIPVAIVNGRITESSVRGYRRVQRWLPRFDRIALYGVQNERYAASFGALEIPRERVVVTGNLKYDNLPTAEEDAAYRASPWPRWGAEAPLLVCASTHEPEEEELARLWAVSPARQQAILVLVPRHPRRADELAPALERALGAPPLRRSSLAAGASLAPGTALLVDVFGELESAFRASRGAFVGGSLIEHGGQNVLEPAALGVPVVVGPHVANFAEECSLLEQGGGLQRAADPAAVIRCFEVWLADPVDARRAGAAGAAVLATRRGAAEHTLTALTQAGILT